MGIAEQMGRVLQRTSVSVNIKERLDFSCALFGPDGSLVRARARGAPACGRRLARGAKPPRTQRPGAPAPPSAPRRLHPARARRSPTRPTCRCTWAR